MLQIVQWQDSYRIMNSISVITASTWMCRSCLPATECPPARTTLTDTSSYPLFWNTKRNNGGSLHTSCKCQYIAMRHRHWAQHQCRHAWPFASHEMRMTLLRWVIVVTFAHCMKHVKRPKCTDSTICLHIPCSHAAFWLTSSCGSVCMLTKFSSTGSVLLARWDGSSCFVLQHVDPMQGNDLEVNNCNSVAVFSVRSVPRFYEQDS
jgi:hypothetical protein